MRKSCYMCQEPVCTEEHAPPKSFFPEAKIYGKDLRKSLIKVPSCEKHNLQKSGDDELFRAMILTAARGSKVATHLLYTKFMRGAIRSHQRYQSSLVDCGPVDNGGRAIEVNREKLEDCLNSMIRALYFHEYQEKLSCCFYIYLPFLHKQLKDGKGVPDRLTTDRCKETALLLKGAAFKGENVEVFTYRIKKINPKDSFVLQAKFYQSVDIFALSDSS